MDGRMWKNVKDKSVVKNLKAITSFEELEKVLKYIQNMQSENIRTLVSEQFDVIVKTCSDSLFSIGQKNCQLFVAKLRNFLDSHNRMVLY